MPKSVKLIENLKHSKAKQETGFTLIEVAIAGVILASIMTAIAQIGVSSMAATKNLSSRTSIEEAINNDIQLLQKADSYLTFNSLSVAQKNEACLNPKNHLITHLEKEVPATNLSGTGINRTMKEGIGTTQDVVEVIYEFAPPENSVIKEYRKIEINPNFSALCYTT